MGKAVSIQEEFQERVLTVAVQVPPDTEDDVRNSLDELQRLIETLGAIVVETCVQRRKQPSPAMFVGAGKADELRERVEELEATLVVFDNELSGGQQRNLENALDCRVMDRAGVILDIFSKHARTKEAKNQVELASLQYLMTRLTHRWTHLERQRGGIGLKGIGEKQIELDRRHIRNRISRLKDEINGTTQTQRIQGFHRDKFLRVALVGYTNAGKSTIMNELTASDVYVDDKLFATLDSTVRVIDPKTRPPILVSDTVGFIRKLPHSLIASFRSTLQQVLDSDLLLHIVDLSAPNYLEQLEATKGVLEEIGAHEKPTMLVFNKSDMVTNFLLPKLLERRYIDCVVVSALNPSDMARLRQSIYAFFDRDMVEMEIRVPYEDVWLSSQIHEYSKVLEKKYLAKSTKFRIRIMKSMANRLKLAERGGQTL